MTNRSNSETRLALQGLTLNPGDTLRIICPECGGGSTSEKSLSVRCAEDGAILYRCFRNRCATKGKVGGLMSACEIFDSITSFKPPPHKVWEGEIAPLEAAKIPWELLKGVPSTWHWTEDFGGRIAMSIRSPKGQHRGWVLRSTNPAVQTKAYTYMATADAVKCSWHTNSVRGPLFIVEDIPSAVALADRELVNAVALLGTSLTDDSRREIGEWNGPKIIALDDDATIEAIKMARDNNLVWDSPCVQPLHTDIKDMTEDEIWTVAKNHYQEG